MKHERIGPEVLNWLGVTYKTILAADETGGAMSIVDSVSPVGSGPPRHIHDREDETFFLITGACEFWLEGKTFVRDVGETVFVPRGKEHTFRVIGDEPCRHLVILTPGGFEGFFRDMDRGQFRIPEDMNRIIESGQRHSLRFTGPPLGAE